MLKQHFIPLSILSLSTLLPTLAFPNPIIHDKRQNSTTTASASATASASVIPISAPSAGTGPGGNPSNVSTPEVDAYVLDLMERYSVKGVTAVIVSPEGEEVKPFGVVDISGTRNNEDIYFAIASNSKLFTAIEVSFLLEENITLSNGEPFSLDAKMKDIIPGFKMKDDNGTETATLRNFLTMRSGLPQHVFTQEPGETPAGSVAKTAYLKSTLPVGLYQYSNQNYVILSYLSEVLLNTTQAEYMQEKLFGPLGFSSGAGFNANTAKEKGERSQGFLRGLVNFTACLEAVEAGTANVTDEICAGEPNAIEFWPVPESDGTELAGGGSIVASGSDLLKWVRELLYPNNIIPPSVLDRIQNLWDAPLPTTNETVPLGSGTYQGGCIRTNYRNNTIYLHDGALPGSLSYLVRVPEKNIGVFVIVNDDLFGSPLSAVITHTYIDALLGLEPYPWEQQILQGSGLVMASGELATPSPTQSGGNTRSYPPSPPPSDIKYASFFDEGYGNLTLLPLNLTNPSSYQNATFAVDYWTTNLAPGIGINLTYPFPNDTDPRVTLGIPVPVFYSEWHHSLGSHFVFAHYDGPFFNYTLTGTRFRVYPEVSINYTTPVPGPTADYYTTKPIDVGTAILTEEGLGLFGNILISGNDTVVQPSVERVKEDASVFFRRV